jgi:hypothetical protein
MDHQSARQKSEKHKKDWKIRQKIVFRFSSDSACSLRMAMDEIESRCQATVTDRSVCLPSPGLIYQDGKVSQAFNFIIATHAARFRASHETITSSRVEPTPLEATPDSRKFNFRAQNNRQERSRKLESRGSDGKSNPIKISNYFVVNTFSEAKNFFAPTTPQHQPEAQHKFNNEKILCNFICGFHFHHNPKKTHPRRGGIALAEIAFD